MEEDIIRAFKTFVSEFETALNKFESVQDRSGYAIVFTNSLRIESPGNEVWKDTQQNTVTVNGHILGMMRPFAGTPGFIPLE